MSFIMLMDLRLFLNCFSTQCTAHLQFIKREMCALVSLLVVQFVGASVFASASASVALLSSCGYFGVGVCEFSAES